MATPTLTQDAEYASKRLALARKYGNKKSIARAEAEFLERSKKTEKAIYRKGADGTIRKFRQKGRGIKTYMDDSGRRPSYYGQSADKASWLDPLAYKKQKENRSLEAAIARGHARRPSI